MRSRSVALFSVSATAITAFAIGLAAWADDDTQRDTEAHERFAQHAAEYSFRSPNAKQELQLHPRSLLNWGNPVRLLERGSLFAWLSQGRPQVIGSIFTYELGATVHEKVELHSLSDDPLTATHEGQTVWAPAGRAIAWRTLDDEPLPASNDRQRLVQMRALARRFGVVLISPEGDRNELRLMTQPLLRYAAPGEKVVDGAIFSFVVATDPEALLLVEAAGPPDDERWRYAFARFHYWELAARLDDRSVWSVEPDMSQATHNVGDPQHIAKPYVSFHPRTRSSK